MATMQPLPDIGLRGVAGVGMGGVGSSDWFGETIDVRGANF